MNDRSRLTKSVVTVALLIVCGVCLLVRASDAPGRAPASRPGESAYPSRDLIDRCDRQAKAMRARVDGTFEVVVRPPFVVLGNFAASDLRRIAHGSVVAPAKVMWKEYFHRRPDRPITILLLRDEKSYRAWALKLFGDRDMTPFGYYRTGSRTMVMNIATGSGTLVHELTHALMAFDFPNVPDWFNEGFASLHEQCSVRRDGIVGMENWRLPVLKRAMASKSLRPLADLLTRDDFYGATEALNYSQARYFVMYMQRKAVLKKFYRHFRQKHKGDGAGVKAVEAVFDRPIAAVDKDYLRWAATLRWPPKR